jgi:hypothetical protein
MTMSGRARRADARLDDQFRPHFRVAELAKLWAVGRETVRQLVMHERMW